MPGAKFVNLQYGDVRNDLAEIHPLRIHHFDECNPLRDLDEFAALVASLDLVISVDNATVHFAGALGVPVWILLPWESDWRWMRDRVDSPWYRSATLYRQSRPGDWPGVFERVAEQIRLFLK
jgi:ADP-heptose:LPS heptosyltransferase